MYHDDGKVRLLHQSRFDDLVSVLFPRGEGLRIMALLTGYFDESGTHDSQGTLVVAGFVGDVDAWKILDQAWLGALKDQSVPFFKAQWFEKRKEFFRTKDWDDENRRKGFMGRLLTAIEDSGISSISCSVSMPDYEDIVSPGKVRNRLGSAYTICCQRCIGRAWDHGKSLGISDRIAYVFDRGHRNSQEFKQAYDRETEEARDKALLGPLAFYSEEKIPGLQAADLLAYEMAHYHRGKRERHPLQKLLNNDSHLKWGRKALIVFRNRYYPQCPYES